MIPTLQRFYGGDPVAWIDMPLPLLAAYAEAKPMLEAREYLALMNVTALGFGGTESPEARLVVDEWVRAAKLKRPGATDAQLAEIGIEVIRDG